MCKIDNCERLSQYKKQDVCQKHYFRFMRYGTYKLTRKPRKIFEVFSPNGYKAIYSPQHPLAAKNGFVFEHRAIFYNRNKGKELFCEFCAAPWSFRKYYDHVDHIDQIKTNNAPENLRPLCNACNTRRNPRIEHLSKSNKAIEWSGEVKTAQEWGRDGRIPAKGHLIRQRLKRGYSVEDAFFAKKLTHKEK